MPVDDDERQPAAGTEPELDRWETLGIDPPAVGAWEAIGFGPFEGAMAHGDGFTPLGAVPYRHQLKRTARRWARSGFDSSEGLRWHRAGFSVRDALRWRSLGIDVETARSRRAGYDRGLHSDRPRNVSNARTNE